MRRNDTVFLLIIFLFCGYVFIYTKLAGNLPLWINDLYSCYSVMNINNFLLNHVNVFFYLFLFFVMNISLLKMVLKGVSNFYSYFKMRKAINNTAVLQYKNITVIDSKEILSFNFSHKIILSTGFLKNLKKEEKKAIYYHEVGHLKHLDGIRYLLVDTLLSIFPDKIKEKISKQFVVISEIYADKIALRKVSQRVLLETVLKIKEFNLLKPSGYNFVYDRFNFVLNKEMPPLPKTLLVFVLILYVLIMILYLYQTCFCGVMG